MLFFLLGIQNVRWLMVTLNRLGYLELQKKGVIFKNCSLCLNLNNCDILAHIEIFCFMIIFV